MSYIGLEKFLNITNHPIGDVYDFMAGALFDGNYADGYAYNAINLPSPDLRSFFIDQSFSLTAGLLNFNEDFCEFVLMPMQIMLIQKQKYNILQFFIKEVEKISNIKKNIQHGAGEQTQNILLSGNIGGSVEGLRAFYRELVADGILENVVEEVGRHMFGPVGAIIGGMAYDGIVNGRFEGANVAEAVYGAFKGLAIDSATSSVLKTVGVSGGFGGVFAVGMVSSLINEIFELAMGVDISFGFGGELVAYNELGQGIYEAPLGFLDGIKSVFGMLDGEYLIISKDDYFATGEIAGFRNSSGIYVGQIGDDLRSSNISIELSKEDKTLVEELAKQYEEYTNDDSSSGSERDYDSSSGSWGGFEDGTGATGGMLA